MDTLNINTTLPQLTRPAGGSHDKAPVPVPMTNHAPAAQASSASRDEGISGADMERKRMEALKAAAKDLFILGDQRFTIFKDSTGQYITRFTSLRDGKVTYIPEPQLLTMSQGASSAPIVTLDA